MRFNVKVTRKSDKEVIFDGQEEAKDKFAIIREWVLVDKFGLFDVEITPTELTIENVVVGPAYPECLYSRTPKWHVDYTLSYESDRISMRKTLPDEESARLFAQSITGQTEVSSKVEVL